MLSVLYRNLGFSLLAGMMLCAMARQNHAGEWPQILGPNRNGIALEEKLAERWPEGRPKVLWSREAGSGYAGAAVSGGKALLFHRIDDEEIAEALDARTGERLWKAAFPTRFRSTFSRDHGPRCVPVVHKDKVFLFGAQGDLHALALADGKKIWTRAAFKEFGAPEGYFGAGSSPLIVSDKLLANVGGARQGAGVVAFDLETGKTVWKATDNQASYSSPITVTVEGVRQAIFVTRLNTVAINPENGSVYWSLPFGDRGPTVNAANPLVVDGHLFLSASYGIGAVYAKLRKSGTEVLWKSDDIMSSQYTTCVAKGGYLYGIDGREDVGEAQLRCIDPKEGKVIWRKDGLGKGTLLLADGKLLIQTTSGTLYLAVASPDGYRELARAKVSSAEAFALPALANGKLYVRGPGVLKCLGVGNDE